MFKNNKEGLRFITLLMAIIMIAMVIIPAVPVEAATVNEAYTVKAEELIQNIYDKYIESKGEVVASSNDTLDGFHIYILNEAGVDVINWKYNSTTVENKLDALIADASAKEATTSAAISSKFMAHLYIAAESSEKNTKAASLLNHLKTRQKTTTNGAFEVGAFSEYSNLPAFNILAITNNLSILEKQEETLDYLLDLNPSESAFPDFMVINQTVRVLKNLRNSSNSASIDPEITKLTNWIDDQHKLDGSFISNDFDVPAVNTAEALFTAKSVDSLSTDKSLEYLIEKNDYKDLNIGVNAWVLRALLLNGAKPNIDPTGGNSGGGTNPTPTEDRIKVDVAVIDDDGDVIYGPKSVRLYKDDKFGFTALGALEEAGLDYEAGKNNDFVTEIEGIKNRGLSGWMYAVNGKAPGNSAAIDKTVKDGDEVLWFYSKSASGKVPRFPDEEDKDKEEDKEKEDDKVVTNPNFIIPQRVMFNDVGANIPWAKDAIEVLAGRGIISGTGTGAFEPNRSINRAEFAKLVVETLGNKSLSQGTGMFSDVDSSKWYADYIGKAFATGLVEGSNGKFRPMESITRNEVAVMLHRMQNKVVPNNGIISFQDEKNIPEWARLSVAYAVERGLIQGYNDNTFRGDQAMTRAEVAVVLYRYITMMNL